MSERSIQLNDQTQEHLNDAYAQVRRICEIADPVIQGLFFPPILSLKEFNDTKNVKRMVVAMLCDPAIEHYKSICHLANAGNTRTAMLVTRTVYEVMLLCKGLADKKLDMEEYLRWDLARRYYDIEGSEKYDLPTPKELKKGEQLKAQIKDYLGGEPKRPKATFRHMAELDKAAFTPQAREEGHHKRARRIMYNLPSQYVHGAPTAKPDPNYPLLQGGQCVVKILNRALKFCLDEDLLLPEDGRKAQLCFNLCAYYLNEFPLFENGND